MSETHMTRAIPAPAVTLAALAATENGADPIIVVTPADQTVTDEAAFASALREAVQAAASCFERQRGCRRRRVRRPRA